MNEKYFNELAENGLQTASVEDNRLPILLDGQTACRVQPSGMMCIGTGDLTTPEASELYHKTAPFSEMVSEYISLLEKVLLIKSNSGNSFYRLLADFNSVILAGKEIGQYGYQFATWYRDFQGTGYTQSNYFFERI